MFYLIMFTFKTTKAEIVDILYVLALVLQLNLEHAIVFA